LAPHGIIEVPLIVLATALGFTVGRESLRWLTGRKSLVRLQLRQGLKTYFKWILLGLLVAAAIEVFITPLIVGLAGGAEFLAP
jgi:stage II sporulation protein M